MSWVYEVAREAGVVYVLAIRIKKRGRLYVGGEEVTDEDSTAFLRKIRGVASAPR